ncbi:NACHT domain-containing protein [Streptomyces genisteinicus]|uniref:AAA+ ATPase domain-containing protein n=1 Tax=Streptomyces genisteinicus TaxID=2768068 RepID=A0A7H0I1B3_9ACTN|nr:hypothetical protein [Streptomyces genisteinicus]QNP66579.1 hypothetical protein IAG43_29085 [Streptomyces genisteinicus]
MTRTTGGIMSLRRQLSFGDALTLLGQDPQAVQALDRALGGALNLATGGAAGTLLDLADGRGRVIGLGRDALRGARQRLNGADSRAGRSELLLAAHTVIVLVAWFEVLGETALPFALEDLALTRSEQVALAGGDTDGPGGPTAFARALTGVDAPRPMPHLPFEETLAALRDWYGGLADALLRFVAGLRVGEDLSEEQRRDAGRLLRAEVAAGAVGRYRELYARLALDVPEFAFWAEQTEHQATRGQVRRALHGIESLLSGMAGALPQPVDVAAALARGHRAGLRRPVLDASRAPAGMRVPALAEMYFDPDFRVRAVTGQDNPADEAWWDRVPVRRDLTTYLAGALTAPGVHRTPLLVLGQPGAGKSALTRVLAARLPAAGFLPVRVPLRDVRADGELQDQIEQAIRSATGEAVSWPSLVRASRGLVPVLLLDGFDELLQTTGVHHNDFLTRVARFQEREADQGRTVLALVTSRTAVADRVRHPEGMVALRLEPFRREQVQAWLAVWNEANAPVLAARGLRPLPPDVLARHAALSAQPLLLTMLALYDAADNGLQREGEGPFDEAHLYEELLTSFARREVSRDDGDAAAHPDEAERVERELQRLSLVAFAVLNRQRQWVTADELDQDLAALLRLAPEPRPTSFRSALATSETALGRFFFIQRAQALRDERQLATYEFLHATFGEYLAVRLALHVLRGLRGQQSPVSLGHTPVNDGFAYALLSYAPLSSRQMLRFATSLVAQLPPDERRQLAQLLTRLLYEQSLRSDDPFPGYRPRPLRVSSRHGIYGANLVLVVLLLGGGTTASALFPGAGDPAGVWHRHVLLWRSSFTEFQWTEFALSMTVGRTYGEDGVRDLDIAPRTGELTPPDPVDNRWLFRVPAESTHWARSYWAELWHKMDVSGGTADTVVRHAMDPVFAALGPAVLAMGGGDGEPATSLAHDLLRLWLGPRSGMADADLAALYRSVDTALRRSGLTDDFAPLVLDLLRRDRHRLDAGTYAFVLTRLCEDASSPAGAEIARHMIDERGVFGAPRPSAALSAALAVLLRHTPEEGIAVWTAAHEVGGEHPWEGDARAVARCLHDRRESVPGLLRERAEAVLARQYPAAHREFAGPGSAG